MPRAERDIRRVALSLPRLSRTAWSNPAVAFYACFAGALAVGLLQGARLFYADSEGYYHISTLFVRNGHFSLLNFSDQAGYAFPLILHVFREFGEGLGMSQSLIQFSATTTLNALFFALIGSVLGPRLAETAWPDHRWGLRQRVALTALLLIFWSGEMNYAMTDFPGLAFACLSLVGISRPTNLGWMFLAGASAAVAINMRPAYLPFVLMLGVIVALASFERNPVPCAWFRRTIAAGILIVAFLAVSLPQSLMSHRYYHSWTFVPGTIPPTKVPFLMTYGMAYQRVDSYNGPQGLSALTYKDARGRSMLERQPNIEIDGPSQYLRLVVEHPVVMIPLLARHFIDGMDARYSTTYVEHRDGDGRVWLRLAGFLVLFLAIVRLLWPAARRSLGRNRWRYLIALSLCCLTSLTIAVETRYLLPIYLLCYLLVLTPGWPSPINRSKIGLRRVTTPALLVVAYVAFMAVIWHVVGSLHGEVVYGFYLPGKH